MGTNFFKKLNFRRRKSTSPQPSTSADPYTTSNDLNVDYNTSNTYEGHTTTFINTTETTTEFNSQQRSPISPTRKRKQTASLKSLSSKTSLKSETTSTSTSFESDIDKSKSKSKNGSKRRISKDLFFGGPSAIGIYFFIVFLLVSIGFATFITRNYFPSNRLMSTKILDINGKWRDFIAEKALDHMDNIAVHRRPHNSFASKLVIDYIQATLIKYQALATANAKILQLGGVDNILYTDVDELDYGEKRGLFVETSNILVRLNGKRYVVGGPSLLVNVNYDSAPASFGAGKNGIGISVALEILERLIVGDFLDYTVMFLFSSQEEMGSLGVRGFLRHPWFLDVRSFINVDARGIGGRPIVTRANDNRLLKMYARVAPYPHANAFVQDIIDWNWIPFSSAYDVLGRDARVSGIEMSFLNNRGVLNTHLDDIFHVTLESVHMLGTNLIAMIREITWKNAFLDTAARVEKQDYRIPIYYDLLGKTMVEYPMMVQASLYSVAIVLGIILLIASIVRIVKQNKGLRFLDVLWPVLRSFLSIFISILLSMGVAMLFALIPDAANPLASYLTPWLVFFYHVSTTFLVFALVQFLFALFERRMKYNSRLISNQERGRCAIYGVLIIWWWANLLANILAGLHYVALYYVAWFGLFWCGGVLVEEIFQWLRLSTRVKERFPNPRVHELVNSVIWAFPYIISTVVPLIVFFDLVCLCIDIFGTAVIDGVNPIAVHALFAILSITLVINFVPAIARAGGYIIAMGVFGLTAVTLLILTSVYAPFTTTMTGYLPNKIYFTHEINATSGISELSFFGMQQVLPALQYASGFINQPIQCDTRQKPHGSLIEFRRGCKMKAPTFAIPDKLAFTAPMPQNGFGFTVKVDPPKTLAPPFRSYLGTVSVVESTVCRIVIPPDRENVRIRVIGMQEKFIREYERRTDNRINEILIVRKDFMRGVPWTWAFQVDTSEAARTEVIVSCFFDDVDTQLPYFDKILAMMPPWATLASFGTGLLRVHKSLFL